MYKTVEIEKIINERYVSKLSKYMKIDYDELLISNIFYHEGANNCIEGLYVWSDDIDYNYMYVEKGRVQKHIKTKSFFDILYIVLNEYVSDLALDYALCNLSKNKDFREILFDKEKEIWSILDKRGERRHNEYIEKKLEFTSYVDE